VDDVDSRVGTANVFAVLSDESLIEDGEDWVDLCAPFDSSRMFGSSAVRDLNVDEIDEDEEKVNTIVLCFIIDVMDLMRKVENAWKEVVEDSMHVVVAVSISVTVLQAIDRQFAELQSQLPSIDDATIILVIICDSFFPSAKIGDCEISKFYEQMMMYLKILRNFARSNLRDVALDGRQSPAHSLPEDCTRFIEQYSLLPMTPSGIEDFLCMQLCLLHRKMPVTLDDVYINFPSSKMFVRSFTLFSRQKSFQLIL
jgi:hypothetical protein